MAQPNIADLVRVSAEASSDTLGPGQTATLAVTFRIAPGWHIYWLNPGDAGMATGLRLVLPDGWTHSPVRFPTPVRFTQPGDLVGFGYKGEATLLVDVTAPPTFTAGAARIEIQTVFLACADVCVPGQETVTISLSAGPLAGGEREARFAELERRIPARAAIAITHVGPPLTATHATLQTWRLTLPPGILTEGRAGAAGVPVGQTGEALGQAGGPAGASGDRSGATGDRADAHGERISIFPNPPMGLELTHLTVEPVAGAADGELIVRAHARLFVGQAIVAPTIPAVLVLESGQGPGRTALELTLPLKAPQH